MQCLGRYDCTYFTYTPLSGEAWVAKVNRQCVNSIHSCTSKHLSVILQADIRVKQHVTHYKSQLEQIWNLSGQERIHIQSFIAFQWQAKLLNFLSWMKRRLCLACNSWGTGSVLVGLPLEKFSKTEVPLAESAQTVVHRWVQYCK